MLWPVLHHHFSQLVVHVLAHASCGFFTQQVNSSNDLGLDWPHCWERLHHRFTLEPDHALGEHRVEHTTRTLPRLSPVFILQAQQFQAIDIGLYPILAVHAVFAKVFNEVHTQRLQIAVVHVLGKVGIKRLSRFFLGLQVNLNAVHANIHFVGVLDLNLDVRLLSQLGDANWGCV